MHDFRTLKESALEKVLLSLEDKDSTEESMASVESMLSRCPSCVGVKNRLEEGAWVEGEDVAGDAVPVEESGGVEENPEDILEAVTHHPVAK